MDRSKNESWASPFMKFSKESSNRIESFQSVRIEDQFNCTESVRLIRGYQKPSLGFLTIGICTVPRSKASYLKDTLYSLIHHMTDEQREEVTIVVFLGYHNEAEVNKTVEMIENNFNNTLSTGGLQIVQPDIDVYPNFSKITKRTFKDSLKRVHWRTKQNIDFAYLFGYAGGISRYYMHMEDDLDAVPNYITDIKDSLQKQEQSKFHWFVLNFGDGFFGQLFRSSDLCMMKKYILLFQDQKPCDLFLEDLKQIQLHDFKNIKGLKSKFEHRGQYSSLAGKTFKIKESKSKEPKQVTTEGLYVSRMKSNPPADIESTFQTHSNFAPEYAYIINNTLYFWAKSPTVGDYYRVKFHSRVLCSRITIRTGAPLTTKDRLDNANVLISSLFFDDGTCKGWKLIGSLSGGKFEHKFDKPQELNCLKVVVTKKQNNWVVISQIEIET